MGKDQQSFKSIQRTTGNSTDIRRNDLLQRRAHPLVISLKIYIRNIIQTGQYVYAYMHLITITKEAMNLKGLVGKMRRGDM